MYQNLGIHWASSIPAFLSLACLPFPFLFYKYGDQIRSRCKFAAEAAQVLAMFRQSADEAVIEVEVEDEKEAAQENVQGILSDTSTVVSRDGTLEAPTQVLGIKEDQ